jgi:predicted methyltransferase
LSALKRYILFYKYRCSNIFQDFQEANHAVSFFIYAIIRRNNNIEDISFEKNVKTNEKLVVKKANHDAEWEKLLIARYPLEAAKNRIRANVKEITEWDRETLDRTISLDLSMPIVL